MSEHHGLPTPRQVRLALVLVAALTAIIAAVVVHSVGALLPFDIHPFVAGLVVGLVSMTCVTATAYGHSRRVRGLERAARGSD